jgi:hypothetical protein
MGGDFHEFLSLRNLVENKSSIRFEYDAFSSDSSCPKMATYFNKCFHTAPAFLFLFSLYRMQRMNRPTFRRFVITFAACSFCVAIGIPQLVVAQDKHPFTWEDSSVLHRAAALSVSPDGKTILCVVSYEGDKGVVFRNVAHFREWIGRTRVGGEGEFGAVGRDGGTADAVGKSDDVGGFATGDRDNSQLTLLIDFVGAVKRCAFPCETLRLKRLRKV